MKEEVLFNNGFFEFIKTSEEHEVDGTIKVKERDVVRRSPGIRGLVVNRENKKILISREYRYELRMWDFRLPGGKVFDSLKEYKSALKTGNIDENVRVAVKRELKEEVGIDAKNFELIKISKAGSGVIWDLYYFEIDDYEVLEGGSELEADEYVSGYEWKAYDEIIEMCISGKINEDRTVAVLLTYILKNK